MTQIETNYAIVLYELGVPQDIVTKTKQIFDTDIARKFDKPCSRERSKASDYRSDFCKRDEEFPEGSMRLSVDWVYPSNLSGL